MAVAGVTWERLSRSVRDTLAWAAAAELDASAVGTRGLLIGMLRSGEDPPNALLRHFGVSEDDLFTALQRQVPDKRLDRFAPERPRLAEVPDLTANAQECVQRAAKLQDAGARADIDVACLLAALLQTQQATARAAIDAVIDDVPIETITEATLSWLRGNDLTYPQTLQQRFPRPPRPAAKGDTATVAPPDASEPWPFLAVLQRHVSIDGEAEVRSIGLVAMIERYEQLLDEHGVKIADAVAVDEPMLHLLDAVEPGFDAAIRDRLDDQADELRKLLSIPDCGLSWVEIGRIRRFTVNFNPAVEEQVRQPRAPAPTDSGTA